MIAPSSRDLDQRNTTNTSRALLLRLRFRRIFLQNLRQRIPSNTILEFETLRQFIQLLLTLPLEKLREFHAQILTQQTLSDDSFELSVK